jgi:hypothetical protein
LSISITDESSEIKFSNRFINAYKETANDRLATLQLFGLSFEGVPFIPLIIGVKDAQRRAPAQSCKEAIILLNFVPSDIVIIMLI